MALNHQPPSFNPASSPIQHVVTVGSSLTKVGTVPTEINCPRCHHHVMTEVNYINGAFVWILVVVLAFFFFPLMCFPCCIDQCKDVEHYCPHCRSFIGLKKRM
uniref:LITAF domain-containing protein n=1 Tax=Plectus sambesii TaxID=2011161 RepID=A0A914XEV4_9BILA